MVYIYNLIIFTFIELNKIWNNSMKGVTTTLLPWGALGQCERNLAGHGFEKRGGAATQQLGEAAAQSEVKTI